MMLAKEQEWNMKISFRKFCAQDIDNKVKWINDPDNNQYLHYDLPLEYNKTLNWFNNIKDRTDRFDAIIEVDGNPVGLIGILGIDLKNSKAEYYVAMGEKGYKGKGIATNVSWLFLDFVFTQLGLNKIYLYTEKDNIPAQKLFEKIGFQREGLLIEDLIYNNKRIDRYVYGITAEQFLPIKNKNIPFINSVE